MVKPLDLAFDTLKIIILKPARWEITPNAIATPKNENNIVNSLCIQIDFLETSCHRSVLICIIDSHHALGNSSPA